MYIPLLHAALCALSTSVVEPPLTPDLDRSGVVGHEDIAIVLAEWGEGARSDLNGDGVTSQGDLVAVMAAQGQRWIYAKPHNAFEHAHERVPIRLDEIRSVREDGGNVHLALSSGYIEIVAGNVIWWIFELAEQGWEGPIFLGEDRVRALGAYDNAIEPDDPDDLWVIYLIAPERATNTE